MSKSNIEGIQEDSSIGMDSNIMSSNLVKSQISTTRFITQGQVREKKSNYGKSTDSIRTSIGSMDDKQKLIHEKQLFLTKKVKKLNNDKKYGFKSAKDYIYENQKHQCLYDKI